jgi:hypothetical protein
MEFRTYYAYCSGLDQRVRVVRKSELMGQPGCSCPYPDESDVVCLEYGRTCTGAICPLFGVPSQEMAHRLAEVGLFN